MTPTYFAVRLRRGPAWNAARPMREQVLWAQHAVFMDALADEGFVVLGGPLAEPAVLLVIDAPSEDVIRTRLAADPWHAAKLLEIVGVEPWTILLDRDAAPAAHRDLLTRAYAAFNARDIDTALATMDPDVEWANGMDGGFVHGRHAVREYWTRQWRQIDPHVEPRRFAMAGGCVVVDVHQLVRDLAGRVRKEQHVRHVYVIEGGLIRRMEIRA